MINNIKSITDIPIELLYLDIIVLVMSVIFKILMNPIVRAICVINVKNIQFNKPLLFLINLTKSFNLVIYSSLNFLKKSFNKNCFLEIFFW